MSDQTTTLAEAQDPRAADGRVPGRRGLATRQRMMDATGVLLETVAYRDLKVVDIAREAGTSPATFYQYFPDVEAAVLAMAADLGEAWHDDLSKLITNRDWEGDPDGSAHRVADGMLEFWTRHQPVLRVLDMASRAAKRETPGDPRASAGVVVGMLAHVANHQHGLERWGVSHDLLVETVAGIIRRTILGVV